MIMKEIPLTQGKVALVDDGDHERLNKFKWCALKSGNTFYAVRVFNKKLIYMHRVINNTPEGKQTDHIDGDGLNNQALNLRVVMQCQNLQNRHNRKTSKYPGVSWVKKKKKWTAHVCINYHQKYLGLFLVEEDAYAAYCAACPGSVKL